MVLSRTRMANLYYRVLIVHIYDQHTRFYIALHQATGKVSDKTCYEM